MTAAAQLVGASGAGGGQGGAPAGQPQDWTGGLSQEHRGFVETKGWKDPGSLLESYRGLERMLGGPREKLVRLPDSDADKDGWNQVYSRLGRPETPDQYELPPVQVGDGQVDLSGDFRAMAHELGLSKSQAKGLAEKFGGKLAALHQQSEEQRAAQVEADLGSLRREWGGEYEANVAAGQRAVKALGWDVPTVEKLEGALGTKGLFQLVARIGRGMGEADFVEGGAGEADARGAFGMTPAAARAKYDAMMGDPEFQKRLLSEDPTIRRAAIAERQRLAIVAFPGAEQQQGRSVSA